VTLLPLSALDVDDQTNELIDGSCTIIPKRTQLVPFTAYEIPALQSDSDFSWKPARSGPCAPTLGALVEPGVDHQDISRASDCASAGHGRIPMASLAPASRLWFTLKAAVKYFGESWRVWTMSASMALRLLQYQITLWMKRSIHT